MGHDHAQFGHPVRATIFAAIALLGLGCGRAESLQSALISGGGEAGAAPNETAGTPTNSGGASTADTTANGSSQASATSSGDVVVGATGAPQGNTGGTGDADPGNGGAAGDSPDGPACSHDPRCTDKPSGASCDGHALTICADRDDDGCLDFEQTNCAPGVCLDESHSCSEGSPGETCADAIQVLHSGFVLSGPDFPERFAGDFELNEHPECNFADPGAADAVFAVALEAGEVLSVHQEGDLESVLALKTSCAAESACIDSATGARGLALEHTATKNETVYVIAQSFQAAPATANFEIRLDIDSACGNGTLEGGEGCDDANQLDGDGCSSNCSAEFPYQCTQTSPSLCSLPPSLGSVGGDEVLTLPWPSRFAQGDELYRTVTFTEPVLVDVLATSNTGDTGDINVLIYGDWGLAKVPGIKTGNENWLNQPFEPGTYLVELVSAATLPDGFMLTLTTQGISCGDGAVAPVFEACDGGTAETPGCEACQIVFGWTCSGAPSVCSELPSIGNRPYSAGEPIEPVVHNDPVTEYVSHYWVIAFSDNVVLSGSIDPIAEVEGYLGYVGISDEWGNLIHVIYPDASPYEFSDLFLPAGKYRVELQTFQYLTSGLTIALQTAAPDP